MSLSSNAQGRYIVESEVLIEYPCQTPSIVCSSRNGMGDVPDAIGIAKSLVTSECANFKLNLRIKTQTKYTEMRF